MVLHSFVGRINFAGFGELSPEQAFEAHSSRLQSASGVKRAKA
ncbi:hypothetical protein HMPREF1990_00117 [Porphyromonas gingivalis W4087]|nr:hypothetical protein HMPREF1990_00117 [Porphyromonas gingivalis W4087]